MKSTEYSPNFVACESRKIGQDFGPAKPELHRYPLARSLAGGECRYLNCY